MSPIALLTAPGRRPRTGSTRRRSGCAPRRPGRWRTCGSCRWRRTWQQRSTRRTPVRLVTGLELFNTQEPLLLAGRRGSAQRSALLQPRPQILPQRRMSVRRGRAAAAAYFLAWKGCGHLLNGWDTCEHLPGGGATKTDSDSCHGRCVVPDTRSQLDPLPERRGERWPAAGPTIRLQRVPGRALCQGVIHCLAKPLVCCSCSAPSISGCCLLPLRSIS